MRVDLGIDVASLISGISAIQTSSVAGGNFNSILQSNLNSSSNDVLQNIINTLNNLSQNQINTISDNLINSSIIPDNIKELLQNNSQGKDGIISILNNLFSSGQTSNTNLNKIADLINQTANNGKEVIVAKEVVQNVQDKDVQAKDVQDKDVQAKDVQSQNVQSQDTQSQGALKEQNSEEKPISDDDITTIINQLQLLYSMLKTNQQADVKAQVSNQTADAKSQVPNQTVDVKVQASDQIADLITKLKSAQDSQDAKQIAQVVKQVESVVEKVTKTAYQGSGKFENLLTEIKTQINTVLKGSNEPVKQTVDVKSTVSDTITSSDNKNEKEDKILKSIIDDGSDKTDKTYERFAQTQAKITNQNTDTKITEAVSIKKETLPSDLVKTVKYMNTNNIKELTVNIKPKELGEIVIKLVQSEGVMKATIKASTNEAYTILSQNESEIKKQLGEQNIKIQSIDIRLNNDTTYYKGSGLENNQFNQNNQNSQSFRNYSFNPDIEDTIDSEQEDEAEILSNINMLA